MSGIGPVSRGPGPVDLAVGASHLSFSSAPVGAANRALLVAFQVNRPVTVTKARVTIGAATSGNIDLGIFDAEGGRLGSTGTTAAGGTAAMQEIALTAPVSLVPGVKYWAAVAADNNTVKFSCFACDAGLATQLAASGLAFYVANSFVLPASVVISTANASTSVPTITFA